jgi:hypothetical protein
MKSAPSEDEDGLAAAQIAQPHIIGCRLARCLIIIISTHYWSTKRSEYGRRSQGLRSPPVVALDIAQEALIMRRPHASTGCTLLAKSRAAAPASLEGPWAPNIHGWFCCLLQSSRAGSGLSRRSSPCAGGPQHRPLLLHSAHLLAQPLTVPRSLYRAVSLLPSRALRLSGPCSHLASCCLRARM